MTLSIRRKIQLYRHYMNAIVAAAFSSDPEIEPAANRYAWRTLASFFGSLGASLHNTLILKSA